MAKTREKEQLLLSENLKRYRKLRGWDQYDLAAATNLGKTTIAGYEQMTRFPSPSRRRVLAEALGISPGALLEDAEDVPEECLKQLLALLATLDHPKTKKVLAFAREIAGPQAAADPGPPKPFGSDPLKKHGNEPDR